MQTDDLMWMKWCRLAGWLGWGGVGGEGGCCSVKCGTTSQLHLNRLLYLLLHTKTQQSGSIVAEG
jgi:hypothetical protein